MISACEQFINLFIRIRLEQCDADCHAERRRQILGIFAETLRQLSQIRRPFLGLGLVLNLEPEREFITADAAHQIICLRAVGHELCRSL